MRTCRDCGCSEFDACVYQTPDSFFTCFWVDADLCSFCALPLDPSTRDEHITPGGGRLVEVRLVSVAGGVL